MSEEFSIKDELKYRDMREELELQPCPFCNDKRNAISQLVLSSTCFVKCYCGGIHFKKGTTSYKKAVELWNNRPIEQELRKKLELVKEALSRIAYAETSYTSKDAFANENSVEFELGQFDKCRAIAQQALQKIAELEKK